MAWRQKFDAYRHFFLWRWRFFAHSKTSQMLYHSDFPKDTIPHKFRFVFRNRFPPNLTNSSSFDKCCKSCVTHHPAFWTCPNNSNPTPDAYAPAKDGLCNGARQKNHKTIKNKCLQGLPNDKISLFLHPEKRNGSLGGQYKIPPQDYATTISESLKKCESAFPAKLSKTLKHNRQ